MRLVFTIILGCVLVCPISLVFAAEKESNKEENVDLSAVHTLAVLPVVIKLEPAKRVSRSNARSARREAREQAAEEERLAVAKTAGNLFRQTFTSFLKSTGYQIIDPVEVDRRVAAPEPGKDLDTAAAGRAVGADAVMTITVAKAANEIGGFSSSTTLKVIMTMVVVSTGQVAWDVEEEETIRSGVLPGGTQMVEIVGSFNTNEAARRHELRQVATGLARKLAVVLPDPHRNLDVVVLPPQIASATTTSAPPFGPDRPVVVEMEGAAAHRASFDLARPNGEIVYSDLPLNEKEPGRYVGSYRPIADDPLGASTEVRVRLAGESGLTSRRWIGDDSTPLQMPVASTYVPPPAPSAGYHSPEDKKGPKFDFAAGWRPSQPRTLAILPFSGKEEGALLLRQTLFGCLLSSQFRLVDNLAVDRTLTRLGRPLSGTYTAEDIRQISEALGADLVMTGEATKWDRTYLAVQSTISTGMKVVVYDGTAGVPVATVEDKKSKSKGLAGIPTGLGSVVIAPISGMSKRFLYRSAFDLTESVAGVLSCVPAWQEMSAPAASPIKSLSYSGATPEHLIPGDRLEITLEAPAGGQAYFNVGEVWTFLPMAEVSPGVYSGGYEIRLGDYLSESHVEAVYVGEGWKRGARMLEKPLLSTATAAQ